MLANDGVVKNTTSNCAPPGMPYFMQLGQYPYEFLFTPGRVTVHQEAWSQMRTIWTDGRGHPEDAIERIARAMRLNPLSSDLHRMEVGTAMAHLLAGHTEDALSWAEKASRHLPDRALPIAILAVIYAHAGRGNQARLLVQRLRELDQAPRLSDLNEWLPFQRSQDLGIFADGLRDSGFPN